MVLYVMRDGMGGGRRNIPLKMSVLGGFFQMSVPGLAEMVNAAIVIGNNDVVTMCPVKTPMSGNC